jgi:hypothetical protein
LLAVEEAGAPTRGFGNIERKMMKTMEEVGELSEAVMGVTSSTNYKNKTWEDVLEEAVDVAIMGLDVALTIPPHECSLISCHDALNGKPTQEDVEVRREKVMAMFKKKLGIWEEKIEARQTMAGK